MERAPRPAPFHHPLQRNRIESPLAFRSLLQCRDCKRRITDVAGEQQTSQETLERPALPGIRTPLVRGGLPTSGRIVPQRWRSHHGLATRKRIRDPRPDYPAPHHPETHGTGNRLRCTFVFDDPLDGQRIPERRNRTLCRLLYRGTLDNQRQAGNAYFQLRVLHLQPSVGQYRYRHHQD